PLNPPSIAVNNHALPPQPAAEPASQQRHILRRCALRPDTQSVLQSQTRNRSLQHGSESATNDDPPLPTHPDPDFNVCASASVVTPASALSAASSTNVFMPNSRACRRRFCVGSLRNVISRNTEFISINSNTALRPRYPVC